MKGLSVVGNVLPGSVVYLSLREIGVNGTNHDIKPGTSLGILDRK
jgi:hypothetical protein